MNLPHKRIIDLMHDLVFIQANKVLTWHLHDNKINGIDVSQPKDAIDKHDMQKLFNVYFLEGIIKKDI